MRGRCSTPVVSSAIRTAVLAAVALAFISSPVGAQFSEDFEEAFFVESPAHYVKDHALVRGPDGRFHLIYIVGFAGEGWSEPGNEVDFGHASSPDLRHWTVHERILPIDPDHDWKTRNVWAPHVIADPQIDGGFLMAYTGVDSLINQAIGIATSLDLFSWTDLSIEEPAFRPDSTWAEWNPAAGWSNCRDPYLMTLGTATVLLTTVRTRDGYEGQPSRGAIALGRSPDGRVWVDSGAPLVINNSSSLMESSHLLAGPESPSWYLFYTRTVTPGGVHFLRSIAPTAFWRLETNQLFDTEGIASEHTAPDTYSRAVGFLTQDALSTRGIRFDSLAWGQAGPELAAQDRFWSRWTLIEGDPPNLPTLFDRPGERTGHPSNVEGHFWVNTAETYAGPYGGGCAGCGPNESWTGVLRSTSFQISGYRIEFLLGGSFSQDLYVALVDPATSQILRRTLPIGSEAMARVGWNVSDLAGMVAAIEIVDRDVTGHISVDDIQELMSTGMALDGERHRPRLLVVPNPVRGGCEVVLEAAGLAPRVAIVNVHGRVIRRLTAADASGPDRLEWDGRSDHGGRAPAGIYFLHPEGGIDSRGKTSLVLLP